MKQRMIVYLWITVFFLTACGNQNSSSSVLQNTFDTQNSIANDKIASHDIDLLVIVDSEDKDNFNGANETKIEHFIAVSNRIYANSNLDIRLNIKKIVPYSLKKQSSKEVLYEVYHDSGIQNLRRSLKADLVMVYRKYANDGVCGIAFINEHLQKEYGYGHVSLECVSTTTAHEIGHTMGLDHNENKSLHYAHGYGIKGEFHTIMAYGSDYESKDQMFNYSSPQLECKGYTCGVDKALENGADAVSALRDAAKKVALFYE